MHLYQRELCDDFNRILKDITGPAEDNTHVVPAQDDFNRILKDILKDYLIQFVLGFTVLISIEY